MRIEKYTGRDSREAMARVRAEFGADAYILANRRVPGGVELTVARDIDAAVSGASPASSVPRGAQPNELQLKALERELDRLRGLLQTELGDRSWREVAKQPPAQSTLRQRLLRLGLSRRLAGSLLERIPRGASLEQGWRLAMGALARRLETDRLSPAPNAVTAIYGGTGVGKTSTLAKLAARDVARSGADAVGLITLDTYRLGAREQLATFAEALGIRLCPAEDGRSLARALRDLRGRRVYIDTAGMSQHDDRLPGQHALVARACPTAQHLLALAGSAQASQSRALVGAFTPGSLSGAIITKVDEAQSLGGTIDVLLQADLALFGITDGQRIPEDFREADGAEVLDRALRLAPPGHSSNASGVAPAGFQVSA